MLTSDEVLVSKGEEAHWIALKTRHTGYMVDIKIMERP